MTTEPKNKLPPNIVYENGKFYEAPPTTTPTQTQIEVPESVAPSQVTPIPVKQTFKAPKEPKEKVNWRSWGGWWLAGLSWAFFITWLVLGVIH